MSGFRYLPSEVAESLRAMQLSARRPVHGPQKGLHRSPFFGSSVEFAEYRDYTPGDPTVLIDWAVFARSDRYVIRKYHEESNLLGYVLLDTSQSLAFRDDGPVTKLDYACSLAAAAMFVLVNQGDAASLITFDRRPGAAFDPAGTSEGLRPLLLALDEVRPTGRGDIGAAIEAIAPRLRGRSMVLLISDLIQEPGRIGRAIRRLHHDGHSVVVLHVIDRGERRLGFGGVAELEDLETSERLVVDVDEVRQAYEDAVARHAEAIRRVCADCLADYREVDTHTPVVDVIVSLGS